MRIVEYRFGQRCERRRRWRNVRRRDRAFSNPPAVVASSLAARFVVDFLARTLADVADHERAGPAARQVVEAPAPRVAQAEAPDLGPRRRGPCERVVRGYEESLGVAVGDRDV